MEAERKDLEQTVNELWRVPDAFDVAQFPHADPAVLEPARELRGPYTPGGVKRQVRDSTGCVASRGRRPSRR